MHRLSPHRSVVRIAAAVAMFTATSTATAQQVAPEALSPVSIAKSEAILSGTPSRLAAIMAQQQGVSLATDKPLQPASRSSLPDLSGARSLEALVSPGATSGRPDIFGSVALSISRTPLDQRWRAVRRARIAGDHAAFAKSLHGLDPVAQAEAVNRYINARVSFVDDSRQFGRADVWQAAAATLRRGRGDCEDYAIAKLQMLRAAGVDDGDLYLVIVKDLVRRSDHAVLVVRAGNRMLLLDNGSDAVVETETVRDYRPVVTFAATGAWTHGYRRAVAPVTIAAVAAPVTALAAPRSAP